MNRGGHFIVVLALTAVALSIAVAAWFSGQGGAPAETAISAAAGAREVDLLARVADMRARVQDDPDDLEGWKALGRSYLALGRYREAVEAWSWVQQRSPRDPQAAAALDRLAEIARRRGAHEKATPKQN